MICPDCHGDRYLTAYTRVNAHVDGFTAYALTATPCSTCGGSGIASCCDGAAGCASDVTNAPRPHAARNP